MALGTTTTASSGSAAASGQASEAAAYDQLIQRQLGRTSWHVKLVDLLSIGALLGVGVLMYLLTLAIIDHWLIPLSTTARWCALLVLVGGVVGCSIWKLLPLLLRTINPTYAARTIEETTPALKNSLITFLDFQHDRKGLHQPVYEALQRKAAGDIAVIPVEHTIDRSPLIRIGYLLVAVLALCAAYKIISPRDPFKTVARVLAPWASIQRPSRVVIAEITPGNLEVFHGSRVVVSAAISGIQEKDVVRVVYTTADGQTVDREVPMAISKTTARYECTLPAPGEQEKGSVSQSGIQQNLRYHVVAGDAISAEYQLLVSAAPTIVVEQTEYQFPAYTGKAPQTEEHQGDLHALEGTRVTLRAVANQLIKSATIEFDPKGAKAAETLAMLVSGNGASASFTLRLKQDRQTPWHQTYQVRFANESGQLNEQPIIHRIEVVPDLAPEVQIVSPESSKVDVPLNGSLGVELRGIDPDFSLTSLALIAEAKGTKPLKRELLKETLQEAAANSSGVPQAIVKTRLAPKELGLKVGDELKFYAAAEDNRTDPLTGKPQPNLAKSSVFTLRVVETQKPSVQPRQGENAAKNDIQLEGDKPREKPAGNKQNDKTKPSEAGSNEPAPNATDENDMPPQPNEGARNEGTEDAGKPNEAESSPNETGAGNETKQPNDAGSADPESLEKPGEAGVKDETTPPPEAAPDKPNTGKNSDKPQPAGKQPSGKQSVGDKGKSGKEGGSQNQSGGAGGKSDSSKSGAGKAGGTKGANDKSAGGGGEQGGDPKGNDQSGGGEGAAGSESSQAKGGNSASNSAAAGKSNNSAAGGKNSAGKPGSDGAKGSQSGAEQPPAAGSHDGDKFAKIIEKMKEKEKAAAEGKTGDGNPGQPNSAPTQGENSQVARSPDQSTAGKSPGAGKSTDKGTGAGKSGETKSDPSKSGSPKSDQPKGAAGKPSETRAGKTGEQPTGAAKTTAGEENSTDPMASEAQAKAAAEQQAKDKTGQSAADKAASKSGDKAADKAGSKGTSSQPAAAEQGTSGTGGKPQGQPTGKEKSSADKPKSGDKPKEKSAGLGKTGEPGAGEKSDDEHGSGASQEANQDRPKDQQGGSGKGEKGEESPPSQSKKQSNSKGGQSGDQSGGGKKGAGEPGGKEGHDTAGGNSAADKGAGQAQEPGMGETGTEAGTQQTAEGKTGQAGTEAGKGSSSNAGKTGSDPSPNSKGAASKDKGTKKPGDNQAGDGSAGKAADHGEGSSGTGTADGSGATKAPAGQPRPDSAKDQTGGTRSGLTGGGGAASDSTSDAAAQPEAAPAGEVPDGDQANLEYAKRATTMALEYLRDQEHNPDPELLKDLGWTAEDLHNFLTRWNALEKEAQADPNKARELDESLQSLGLTPSTGRKQKGGNASDNQRNLRYTGTRVAPPARYRDQFDAFRKRSAK